MIKLTVTVTNAVVQMSAAADEDYGLSVIRGNALVDTGQFLIFDSSVVEDATVDAEATQVIDVIETIPNPKSVGTLRRLWGRIRHAAIQVVRAIRRAIANPRRAENLDQRTLVHRYRYAGSHRTRANAFGRTRSTSEMHGALNTARRQRGTSDSQEGELPHVDQDVAFIDWVERYIQRMRDEGVVAHPPGRHFICS